MSDPLSVASGVAGLICLGSTVSKLFYSFFMSTIDAPGSARSLASALFSLNTSLGQVQEVLLNREFVQQANDPDILDLEQCLTRCAELFSGVECRVQKSGLAEQGQGNAKKLWESVKWAFKEQGLEESMRKVGHEKATLAIILEAFNARMTASILDRVGQLQVLAKKHDRRLKDIHVWCQWATDKLDGAHDVTDGTEYSVFTATQAYTSGDLRNLLHSSGSVLSLQIGDLSDDSISMIWAPDSESAISPRRVKSVLSPIQPTPEDLQRARGIVIDTYVSQQLGSNSRESPLQNLADLFKLAERSCSRRSRQVFMNSVGKSAPFWRATRPVVRVGDQFSPFFSPFMEAFFFFEQLVVNAKENNQSIMDDLTEIRDLINTINFVGGDQEIEEELCDLKERVFRALSEYIEHATEVFKARTRKQIINDLSGVYEKRREKLVKNVKRSVKAYKFRYQVCTTEKLLRQQQEAIDLKRRELELKIKETTVGITEILPPGGNEDSRSEVDRVTQVD